MRNTPELQGPKYEAYHETLTPFSYFNLQKDERSQDQYGVKSWNPSCHRTGEHLGPAREAHGPACSRTLREGQRHGQWLSSTSASSTRNAEFSVFKKMLRPYCSWNATTLGTMRNSADKKATYHHEKTVPGTSLCLRMPVHAWGGLRGGGWPRWMLKTQHPSARSL